MTRKEKQQRSNLARTAIFLLEDTLNEFHMENFASKYYIPLLPYHFISKDYTCGTTCCFAGYGPLALNNARYYRNIGWVKYTAKVFGINSSGGDKLWEFLFDQDWPNDRKQAAARALWYLNGKYIDDRYDEYTDTLFYKSYSKAKLIRELKKHIYIRNR